MGGRSESKLAQVRAEVADDSIPLVVADSHDEESLRAMAQRARVICTTVGPYGKYGSKLVAACVASQTHYCDLAGEVTWIRSMIDQHHEAAQANGTKIVNCCGFDSIPFDMGVYFVQKEAMAQTGEPAPQIQMRVKAASGGISGGTYASMGDMMEKTQEDRSLYQVLIDPYSLNPESEREGPDGRDLQSVVYDEATGGWIAPFIMAGINTKIVRRSNALSGYAYGKNFRYDEAVMTGSGFGGRLKGYASVVPLAVMFMAKPGSFLKKGLDRMMPKPGEGPNSDKREAGFYNLVFVATLADGSTAVAKVKGDMDPGYGSTSKMMAECAVCLAKGETTDINGVITPSAAMGDALLKRLQDNAGLTFSYAVGAYAG